MQIKTTSGLRPALSRPARRSPIQPQDQKPTDRVELSLPKSGNLQVDAGISAVTATAGAIGGAAGAVAGEHLRLIMVGPPGAGKGTQARFLLENQEGAHISTGAMLRDEVARGTELGKKAKPYMDRGELVPDDLVMDMVRGPLEQEDSFILDGFPRSVPQAEALDELLEKMEKPLTSVVLLEVSDETILKRLLKRGRADDNEETIRNRIEVYRRQTEPMINYFRPQGLVETINVEGALETNRQLVAERVGARRQGEPPSLSVPIPTSVLTDVRPIPGASLAGLIQNMDAHIENGKAPYAPSWTEAQRKDLTEKSKHYLREAVKRLPDLTLPEMTEASKIYGETETLALQSSEQNVKYGRTAALLSAAFTGLGMFTGNSVLSAIGGTALAGSLLFSAHELLAIDNHRANVTGLGGTRDLLEGWSVSLKPGTEN